MDWILLIASQNGRKVDQINYVFCSDAYLLSLNKTHLDHHYYTDILTFPFHESKEEPLGADIYISVDRVGENAQSYEVSFLDELHRVMIHGLLHLVGFDDHGDEAKAAMRAAEDVALKQRGFQ